MVLVLVLVLIGTWRKVCRCLWPPCRPPSFLQGCHSLFQAEENPFLLGFSGTETEREQRIGAKKGYYERKDNGEEDQKDLRNLPRLMRESTCSARDSKSRLTKKTSDSDRQVSHVSFLTTVP